MDTSNEPVEAKKARLRAWLYELLAQTEMADDVDGRREQTGNKVTIEVSFSDT